MEAGKKCLCIMFFYHYVFYCFLKRYYNNIMLRYHNDIAIAKSSRNGFNILYFFINQTFKNYNTKKASEIKEKLA